MSHSRIACCLFHFGTVAHVARTFALLVFASFSAAISCYARPAVDEKPLRVFFIDVEGGQATLFITSGGQSLLIDTGWPGNDGRDADRIVTTARKAGLSRINYVLITHYHDDHVGGAPQLAARIPVDTFIDHGENRESGDAGNLRVWKAYEDLLATGKYKRISAKPGDVLPISSLHATVVSADGALLQTPLPGAGGLNPACKETESRPGDQSENPRSLGLFIRFGKLKILDLGDLTWDKELQLMCPDNKLGKVDVYIVSHHGFQQSGSPALVDGIEPRIAIMDNGAKKGGSPSAWTIIKSSPHLEDLWQLHFSVEGGKAHNVPDDLIANPGGLDAANYLELTGSPDGSFTVFNSRTQKTKQYPAR